MYWFVLSTRLLRKGGSMLNAFLRRLVLDVVEREVPEGGECVEACRDDVFVWRLRRRV